MGQGLIGHPAALVMCDEIIGYVKRFMRGFDIDDRHIGLEEIGEVGPGGNFLGLRTTARMFRDEPLVSPFDESGQQRHLDGTRAKIVGEKGRRTGPRTPRRPSSGASRRRPRTASCDDPRKGVRLVEGCPLRHLMLGKRQRGTAFAAKAGTQRS